MRRILAVLMALIMMLSLAACGSSSAPAAAPEAAVPAEDAAELITGVEDGVLTIAMECAYAPYNWTQSDDSNGAVPIANEPGSYANGYDVMIGRLQRQTVGSWKSCAPTGTLLCPAYRPAPLTQLSPVSP